MARLITLLFLFITTISLIAQNSHYPDQPYSDLYEIVCEGDNIFASGSCALGMYSNDAGASWEFIDIPAVSILDLAILPQSDGKKAVLMGSNKLYLWDTEDNSISDIDVTALTAFGAFRGMETQGENIYIISNGAINYAKGNDLEWNKLTDVIYDVDYSIVCTAINSDKLYIGSSMGHIFEADLADGTYVEVYDFGVRIRSLAMPESEIGYASISGITNPYKTTDSGDTWTILDNFPENNNIYAYDKDKLVLVNTNRYFVSTDGGETVEEIETDSDANVHLIYTASFSEDGTLYMAGIASTMIKSNDFGYTYENLSDFNKSSLRKIEINSNGYGIAVGDLAIFTTEDEGENWSEFDVTQIDEERIYLSAAVILDDNKYMVGHDDGIAIIDNGVLTFESEKGQSDLYYSATKDFLIGITSIGTDYVINKSTDDGATWDNKYFSSEYIRNIESTAGGKLYILSDGGQYLLSEDDGESWEIVNINGGDFFREMELLDDGTSLFANPGKFLISEDGGVTTQELGSTGVYRNLHFLAPDNYIYSREIGISLNFYEKKPGIEEPEKIGEQCSTAFDSHLLNKTVWLAQIGGHINKIELDAPSNVQEVKLETFAISPNPATLGTSISLPLNTSVNAQIQVYNAMGQLVYEGKKSTSNQQLNLSAAIFSTGLYIINIEESGKRKQAKLIII